MMNSKEIKASLKEAREKIDNKDYRSSLAICKKVLNTDGKNHMAMVLCSVCLQELNMKDEALRLLQKVTKEYPDHVLGWQGLASYFEKHDPQNPERLKVYAELRKHYSGNNEKFFEICRQEVLLLRQTDLDACISLLEEQLERAHGMPEQLKELSKIISKILSDDKNLKESHRILLFKAWNNYIHDPDRDNMDDYQKFLKHLYKANKNEQLIRESQQMRKQFPNSAYPLEWLCRLYIESKGEDTELHQEFDIKEICEALLENNSASHLGLISKGIMHFTSNQIDTAVPLLEKGVRSYPNLYGWLYLAHGQLKFQNYCHAEVSAREGSKLVSRLTNTTRRQRLERKFSLHLATSLSHQNNPEKWNEALDLCHKLLQDGDDLQIYVLLGQLHRNMNNLCKLEKCIDKLKPKYSESVELAILHGFLYQLKDKDLFRTEMQHMMEKFPSNSTLRLMFAQELWDSGDYELCKTSYLIAAKCDPGHFVPFLQLGKYYQFHGNDFNTARRCYSKALQLNPRCADAGINLSECYRTLGLWEENCKFLSDVTESDVSMTMKWAWFEFGLHYLLQGDLVKAIHNLEKATQIDPYDSQCWECLGDAHFSLGAHGSALNAFKRAKELDSSAMYPAFNVGKIERMIGQFTGSITEFNNFIEKHGLYIPALKEQGQAYLELACDQISAHLDGLAKENIQRALQTLSKIVTLDPNIVCVWKLLGDTCSALHHFPSSMTIQVPHDLTDAVGSNGDTPSFTLKELLELGATCYRCALYVLSNIFNENGSCLWYDLGINYGYQADNAANASEAVLLCEKAVSAMKDAVKLKPDNDLYWNGLGVIAMRSELKNYALAQHCFVKCVTLQPCNFTAWTNLGMLYLSVDNIELASKAFFTAHSINPEHISCWIGKALISEITEPESSLDLWCHTSNLGIHPESSKHYAYWMFRLLEDQQSKGKKTYQYHVKRISAIVDLLSWYIGRIHSVDSSIWNLYGLFMEREQLYRSAANAFEKALALETEHSDEIRCNYGRVLIALKRYAEAIIQFQNVKESDFSSHITFALALFKDSRFEESYASYESALHWLAVDDEQKSHILVAMATMAYKFQGVDSAKTLLFQSCQLKPASINGLFSLCALGILHGDPVLVTAGLQELQPYEESSDHRADILFLKASVCCIQGDTLKARRLLCDAVHKYPTDAKLWHLLTLHLVQYNQELSHAIAMCGSTTFNLGRGSIDVSQVLPMVSLSSPGTLRCAQSAVHIFPCSVQNWVVLIVNLLSYIKDNVQMEQNQKILSWSKNIIHLFKKTEHSGSSEWISRCEESITGIENK